MLKESEPVLICMVGISGSGKSTKAKGLSEAYGCIVVSSDEIRKQYFHNVNDTVHGKQVFEILYSKVAYALKNRRNVIADATFLTRKSRNALLSHLNGIPCKKVAYVMDTPYECCVKQNENGDRDHVVPSGVLEKQRVRLTIPEEVEGFDQVIVACCNEKESIFDLGCPNKEEIGLD